MTAPHDNLRRDSTNRTRGERVSRLAALAGQAGARLWRGALTLVYPPQCIACQAATGEAHALCPACWSTMPLISDPVCARLGTPFEHDFGPGMLSPAAIADPPRFDQARAVARHDGAAKALVARLKYGERLDLARSMATLMAGAGREMLATCDLIVPVPMHRGRLWRRRYNQAALLALELGRLTGKPVSLDALLRVKRTPPQVGLTRNERRANLAGAFKVDHERKASLAGLHLVVIDDVRTTGSTLNACAHILRQAGAARIDVLTFTLVPTGMA
ncbi:MAG: ComF family protein [Rhizobiales bacterium]|nr:ComF family protein [Hyphomicrobiales bacterium]